MAVITISRQVGAHGDALGRVLAEQLGYRLVGRTELVRLAAEAGGSSDALDRSPELRERSPSFWERLNEERRRYASVLRNVVTQLAEEGDVVIIGLGAGQLLRELGQVLRLQIVAPPEFRLARLMELGEDDRPGPLSREQARELMRQRDRERAGYMRYLFNIDWLEAHHWDLVINTGRFSIAQSAALVVAVVQTGALQPSQADRLRLANLGLASRIEAALLNEGSVWVNALKVWAENGVVRLEGEVITEDDREMAEQIVLGIPGVRTVANDLRIQPPPLTGM